MQNEYQTVWGLCLHTIKKNISLQSYKTWFEPIKPVHLNDKVLTIQVPNKFFYEWLEEHYVHLLKMAIRNELGVDARLEYQILLGSEKNNSTQASSDATPNRAEDSEMQPGAFDMAKIQNPYTIPGIRRVRIEHNLNPNYHFSNYIEGDFNRIARNAGLAIANKPGGTSFNPLFLYGDVGLGKTHLAQAIGNEVVNKFQNLNVLYVSAEKFTNQIVNAIRNNAINDLTNYYQTVDVLIVDDIQFLSGKQKTQEIFFHLFNQLHQTQKQIILTSDQAPKDLAGIQERLISRFKWGLSADLSTPDLETRMAILDAKLETEGKILGSEVLEFICHNINNNIRELEGVMISLLAHSSLDNRDIDLDLAKEVIRKFVSNIQKEITVENIQELVANHFKLSVDNLTALSRKRSVVEARQLAMYLAKKMTSSSLKTIGDQFGGRDHSTVIYSCKVVQDMMDTDTIYKETVAELERKINQQLG